MSRPLPRVMVAPNGARRTRRADHPAIPVTVDTVVRDALACRAEGADGIHAHVRDKSEAHVLDPDQYREVIDHLASKAPGFYVQVTSESAGRYTPAQQRAFLAELAPPAVSISVREFLSDTDHAAARAAYELAATNGVDIQHILYDMQDVVRMADAIDGGTIQPLPRLKTLLVHGRYGDDRTPPLAELETFLAHMRERLGNDTDYAVCSFGAGETDVLRHVLATGGKVRVGFENNLLSRDGNVAPSNADRVREILAPS